MAARDEAKQKLEIARANKELRAKNRLRKEMNKETQSKRRRKL